MEPGIRDLTVTVLVSLYTVNALSTSEPWRTERNDVKGLLFGLSLFCVQSQPVCSVKDVFVCIYTQQTLKRLLFCCLNAILRYGGENGSIIKHLVACAGWPLWTRVNVFPVVSSTFLYIIILSVKQRNLNNSGNTGRVRQAAVKTARSCSLLWKQASS